MKSPISRNTVMNPQDMNAAFAQAYNSGDIDNLLALYEPESILINLNGGTDQGLEPIRTTLEGLLQFKGAMVSKNIYCIPFEDIAMLRAHFILDTVSEDGKPLQIQGHTSEIVRKQLDNSWKYIVDHPFGADPLQ
jgi:ketosteroid isomerase-like protein